MKRAILTRFIIVIISALLLCGGIFSILMNNILTNNAKTNMLYALRLLDNSFDYSGDLSSQSAYLNNITLSSDTRITLIDFSGRVLADTDAQNPENHAGRREFISAVQDGLGTDVRVSKTTGHKMMYTAMRSANNNIVLRLAVPFSATRDYLTVLFPVVLLSLAAATALSLPLAGRFSRSVSEPLVEISKEFSKINKTQPQFREYKYDELNYIAIAAHKLSDRIDSAISLISSEKNKTEYILENMEEGLIILDDAKNVTAINGCARKILGCTNETAGRNICFYAHNIALIEAADRAAQGISSHTEITSDDARVYSVHIGSIKRGELYDILMFFVDITEEKQGEIMRREFFSNASHELKTPITSIAGYAEILQGGLVSTEEQKSVCLGRIRQEAANITSLINDILEISRLESGHEETTAVAADVHDVLSDSLKSFEAAAAAADITLGAQCPQLYFYASRKHLTQIFNNLVSNAVKYNRRGGSVSINVQKKDASLIIVVSDTGIGIAPDSIKRVCERFYRVEKGRSKAVQGTGLGLAIVKHIVNCYNGSIDIQSRVGEGTTITVTLFENQQ